MLTSLGQTSSSSVGTLIVKDLQEYSTNVVFYTVPINKTFRGQFVTIAQQNCTVKINGKDMKMGYGSSAAAPVLLTLPAGTVVSTASSYVAGTLIGLES